RTRDPGHAADAAGLPALRRRQADPGRAGAGVPAPARDPGHRLRRRPAAGPEWWAAVPARDRPRRAPVLLRAAVAGQTAARARASRRIALTDQGVPVHMHPWPHRRPGWGSYSRRVLATGA